MSTQYLLSLLQLTDPTLPIGGFSHSAGLETYVQQGIVHNTTTAHQFVTRMLCANLKYNDAAFMALAYDAALEGNLHTIIELDNECSAVKLPREMRQASQKLGQRLLKIFAGWQQHSAVNEYALAVQNKEAAGNYCIVFGMCAHALRVPKAEALYGFYYNAAAGMVMNSVKLIPLGQLDGQQILFSLQPIIQELVQQTLLPDRSLLGLCCPAFDIHCMQHEILYSRLYMS